MKMTIKEQLHAHCINLVRKNIEDITTAIADRREAMHNETKSSMGDKYETTREMLQQDINMNMQRLSKAKAELTVLNGIEADKKSTTAGTGSMVITDNAIYYIAVSLGAVQMGDKKYYVVSADAPVALQLRGMQAGDSININGKEVMIQRVV